MTDTGLPELPFDYYWRVSTNFVAIRKNLPDSEWHLYNPADAYYSYDSYDTVEKKSENREREIEVEYEARALFGKRTKTKKRVVREYRYVNRSVEVFRRYTEYSGESQTTRAYLGYNKYYAPETIKLRLPVTRDTLPPLCEKALEEWNAETASKALLGDYPPKTLN